MLKRQDTEGWVRCTNYSPLSSACGPYLTCAGNTLAFCPARAQWAEASVSTLGPHSHVSSREARSSSVMLRATLSLGTKRQKQAEHSSEENGGDCQVCTAERLTVVGKKPADL